MASYKHFKRYCKDIEKVENYEKAKADNFEGWHCHHRRGVDISKKELIALGMYYSISPDELIFLTASEHQSLHHKGKPKPKTEETKKRMSEARKGKYTGEKHPRYGKHHSDEAKKKMRKAHKKLSEETKKKMSIAHKGITPWNKGKLVSEEIKNKISEAQVGRHWYNNGKINKFCYECPDGFTPGRLR